MRPRSLELGGYVLLALGLAVLLWNNVRHVDGFYLDEWLYSHTADYIAGHPSSLWGTIPGWDRGPQRLYPLLLAFPYGLFGTSTAFSVGHMLNVLLLASAVVPLALLARQLIEAPLLRLLAVALALLLPWLMIANHLLTESLTFVVFLWTLLAIMRAAEVPTLSTQLVALGAIGVLTVCRINLGTLFGVLVVAVVAAEVRDRVGLKDALRRRWPVVGVVVLGVLAVVALELSDRSALGHYSNNGVSTLTESLWGDQASLFRTTLATYGRGLIEGVFVLPFALGLAVALAGAFGRLERRFVVVAWIALSLLVAVVVAVAASTKGGAIEERYVFYVVAPLAVLAVAGLPYLPRLWPWMVPSGALVVVTVAKGTPSGGEVADFFFARPGASFWGRVLDHRVRDLEDVVIDPNGWFLIALGLVALTALLWAARRWPRPAFGVLAAALAVCAVAQTLALNYSQRRELFGTSDAPGGIARAPGHDADRPDFVDEYLPDDAMAMVVPGVSGAEPVLGGVEAVLFWNTGITKTADLGLDGAPPAGEVNVGGVATTRDGLGRVGWAEEPPPYLVALRDDPRVQFAGDLVAEEPSASRYALYRRDEAVPRAVWTAVGLQGDGVLLEDVPVSLVLDREGAPDVRAVELEFRGTPGAAAPQPYRVTRGGRRVTSGDVDPGATRSVRLIVPPCADPCPPVTWRLAGTGEPTGVPTPGYGPPPPQRPVVGQLVAARLMR